MNDLLNRRLRLCVLGAAVAAVGVSLVAPVAAAQDQPEASLPAGDPGDAAALPSADAALTPAQIAAMASGRRGSSAGDLPDASQLLSGLTQVSASGAPMSIYYAAKADAQNPSEIYAAVPMSTLGKDLLLALSVNSGPQAGFQWSDYLVRFERRGNNLVLMVPNLSYKENTSGPIGDVIDRTFKPTVLETLPIRGTGPGGSLVVDLSPMTMGTTAPGLRGAVRRDLSRHTKVKVFPENILIDAEQVSTDGSVAGMSFAFRDLPDRRNPMMRYEPRIADERVGYFLTTSEDWGKKVDEKELLDRYINRWRLEKLDPSLDRSPPKEPIVFYIEKTVPVQFREYVAAGILEWNKAFEQVGIIDAIQVRQQTDTAYADIDPEDARYNFIRWIVSGRAFAMGPSRVDPRTGQILDADIIFDDSMLRFFQQDLDLLGPKEVAGAMGAETLEFWRDNPGFRPMGLSEQDVSTALYELSAERVPFTINGSNLGVQQDAQAGLEARDLLAGLIGGHDHAFASRTSGEAGLCSYGDGIRGQLMTAHLAHAAMFAPTTRPDDAEAEHADAEHAEEGAEAEVEAPADAQDIAQAAGKGKVKKTKLPIEFLGTVMKEVVAHEVGHTLGLRHNFKASSWLSLDEIKQRRGDKTLPTVASVMDYNPTLLFAGDDTGNVETFVTPVIGPYDLWAVEYGYAIAPRGREAQTLAKILSRSGEKALQFQTDEDTTGLSAPDPYVNRYDMGDDQVAWAKTRVELANKLMESLEDWAVESGDSNDALLSAFQSLLGEKVSATTYVARVIGGQSFSRVRFSDDLKDADKPGLTPISAQEQRDALAYLAETALADGFYSVDPELLNKLVPARLPTSNGGRSRGDRVDYPIHDVILNAQNRALSPMLNPTVLQRLYDAQLKTTGEDKFTVAELLTGVADAVWTKGLTVDAEYSEAQPMYDSVRRNLQTQHLNYLSAIAQSEPGQLVSADVRNLVRYQLRQLSAKMGKALENAGQLDMGTAAHLTESKSHIDRVLEAPMVSVEGGGGQTIIMMGREAE